ncbi:maleylpyruvate isomerase family mycothiol-dependent enzyme [Kitasatospora sp. NBC_00240]|uniref:maleylpyruvate isomerase family mycothiol-dependent enzyme n=1 Tax=Kitasatospora sp. NBC_00240 TaxID=2903567 RepID=UPI00224C88B6|nr:maleylpyruvate isomerase family mycothiol-dependent enzyme [Kitasatospora sp. NBC_00240]MCX5213736.1 maleylpyruvate isomerase family mycothiol-dependent enzyme [Kitasatospora sp. NBC_00240]
MTLEKSDLIAALRRDAARLAAAAEHNLGAVVPSCPDWTVADLVRHTGVVHRFWRLVAAGEIAGPGEHVEPPRPADADLVAWFAEGAERAAATLEGLDPALPRWSWADRKDVGFIQRRMAQETAVHAWDAVNAAGRDEAVERVLAMDGVDELLAHFLPPAAPAGLAEAGLHLHATDGAAGEAGGEWTLRAVDGRWLVGRLHGKGAAAARGTASDLLLLLWGRRPAERVEVFGDPDALKAYLANFVRS